MLFRSTPPGEKRFGGAQPFAGEAPFGNWLEALAVPIRSSAIRPAAAAAFRAGDRSIPAPRADQGLQRRFNRQPRQPLHQELLEQDGRAGVARQHFRQENRKGVAASAPLPAIRAKDPLPSLGLLARFIQIVPVKEAVTVQRLGTAAAEAALLLEGKSSPWSCF